MEPREHGSVIQIPVKVILSDDQCHFCLITGIEYRLKMIQIICFSRILQLIPITFSITSYRWEVGDQARIMKRGWIQELLLPSKQMTLPISLKLYILPSRSKASCLNLSSNAASRGMSQIYKLVVLILQRSLSASTGPTYPNISQITTQDSFSLITMGFAHFLQIYNVYELIYDLVIYLPSHEFIQYAYRCFLPA